MTTLGRRFLAAVGALFAVLIGLATPVYAHATLISTNPADGEVVAEAPPTIVLTFTEGVDPIEPGIRLVDADGKEVSVGAVSQSAGAETMSVDLDGGLADGSYVVAWQAVSADAHNIRGAFTFSVGAESATRAGIVDELFESSASSSSTGGLLGVGRFASYLGIAVLVGGLVMTAVLAPAALGSPRVGLLLGGAMVAAVVGTAVMIATQATLVGSSAFDWASVASTASGRWWLIRLIAAGVFGVLVLVRGRLAQDGAHIVTAIGGLGVLAVVAAGGHAVTGRLVPLGFAVTVVHLAAMAMWVGGLALIAFGAPRTQTWDIASRFSPWALGSVAVLSLTGLFNGWRQIGLPTDIASSSYGRWLIVKVALVAAVVAAAAFSRRLVQQQPGALDSATAPLALSAAPIREPILGTSDDPRLRRTVLFEAFGIALVLAATSGLVNSAPPKLTMPSNVAASSVVGDRIVQVDLEPAVIGGTELHVTISSADGSFDEAAEIEVTAQLVAEQLGPIEFEMIPVSANHVTTNSANFPVAGLWTIEVTARYGDFDQVVFTLDVPVEE
jgi:copper transport protein